VDWEADLIAYFRNHPAEKELVGERDTPTPLFFVQTYGSVNGFGWRPPTACLRPDGLLSLTFQDHSVLETQPSFSILLGLGNASPKKPLAHARGSVRLRALHGGARR
jgi:hypothetical protein